MAMTTLAQLYKKTISENWDNLAFSDYDGGDFKYGDIAEIIQSLHLFYQVSGIKRGDKFAFWAEIRPVGAPLFFPSSHRGQSSYLSCPISMLLIRTIF